jgi:hypothetical protein
VKVTARVKIKGTVTAWAKSKSNTVAWVKSKGKSLGLWVWKPAGY